MALLLPAVTQKQAAGWGRSSSFTDRLQDARKKTVVPDSRATTCSVLTRQQSQGLCLIWYGVSYPAQEMSVTQAYGDQERT